MPDPLLHVRSELLQPILRIKDLQMMIFPVNPVDGAVAVPPGRSSIQSRAHPSIAVVSRQPGSQAGRHMFMGVRRSRTMVLGSALMRI